MKNEDLKKVKSSTEGPFERENYWLLIKCIDLTISINIYYTGREKGDI